MTPGAAPGDTGYVSHGLRINSAVALPELESTRAATGPLPEIAIRIGPVATTLDGARHVTPLFQIAGRDVLFEVPEIARYRVRHGEEIVVDPLPGAPEKGLRMHLLGTALAMLCIQRGLLPLHANAIEIGGRAVCFVGNSGVGKSTLTAMLQKRDHAVLSDDVCVVSLDDMGRTLCWPGIPRLKLWREAAAAVGEDISRCETLVDGVEKYHVPLSAPFDSGPLPLHRLYVLQDRRAATAGRIDRLTGIAAVNAILENTYRGWAVAPMGMADTHFHLATAIARSVEVFLAGRRWGLDVYEDEVDRIERHVVN